MAADWMTRRRRRNLVFGVLAVAVIASVLLAVALFYMGRAKPGF
jgi:hypothetical protein